MLLNWKFTAQNIFCFIDLNMMKYVYYSTINITTLLFNIFYINVYVFLSNKVEKLKRKINWIKFKNGKFGKVSTE